MNHRSIATACLGMLAITVAATSAGAAPSKVHRTAARITPFDIQNSNARAAGLINADGSIAYEKGIKAVTNPSAGLYCVTLYPKTNAAAVAPELTFNYNSTQDFAVFVTYGATEPCATANSVPVVTYTTDSGTHVATNEGFSIVIP